MPNQLPKISWMIILMCATLPGQALGQEGSRASIVVATEFEARLLPEIEVTLLCNSGEPREQTRRMPANRSVDWTVEGIEDSTTYCQLRASPPRGYRIEYVVASDADSKADRNGCQYGAMKDGQRHRCLIKAEQNRVPVAVYKKWIGGTGAEPDVLVRLDCGRGDSPGMRYVNQGLPASWEIDGIPPQGLRCDFFESPGDGFVADESDCRGLLILPGRGEECTMVNTKVVKRIEMLNRYGKAIMIVVMLLAGLFAVRRYV